MIKFLNRIGDLKFPIVTCKKYNKLVSNKTFLQFDGITLTNHGNLFNTFQLALAELPETFVLFATPEILLANLDKIKNNVLIDDKLDIFKPLKKIKVTYETKDMVQVNERKRYLLVEDIPYYLPLTIEKSNSYPLIALLEGLYFHVGWTDTKETYEKFI